METILQCDNPKLFSNLHAGTIQRWLEGKAFSNTTINNVKRGHALAGTGRVGVLAKYPDIVDTVKQKLLDLRASGVPVGAFLTHTIMLSSVTAATAKSRLLVVVIAGFSLADHQLG
jgi:hypothetical protein